MKRISLFLGALMTLGIACSSAQADTVLEQDFPVNFVVSNCVEDIHLTGTVHGVFSETTMPSGGFSVSFHYNPQGVSGVGMTSGQMYRGTGVTRSVTVVTPPGGIVYSYVNQFHIVGTGGAPSYDLRETAHLTVTPNGDITASFDNFSISC